MVCYKEVPSPNFSNRVIVPRFIVVHYTASSSDESAINWMANPDSKVSAHLVISKKGEITQMVELNKRAWHAGPSSYDGWHDLNSHSIGIELVNRGTEEYPEEQLVSLDECIKHLLEEFPTIYQVVGHSEIDIETDPSLKKRDPGPQFPMERYRLDSDNKMYEVTASLLNVREYPKGDAMAVGEVPRGFTFELDYIEGCWMKIKNDGFVHGNYVRRLS